MRILKMPAENKPMPEPAVDYDDEDETVGFTDRNKVQHSPNCQRSVNAARYPRSPFLHTESCTCGALDNEVERLRAICEKQRDRLMALELNQPAFTPPAQPFFPKMADKRGELPPTPPAAPRDFFPDPPYQPSVLVTTAGVKDNLAGKLGNGALPPADGGKARPLPPFEIEPTLFDSDRQRMGKALKESIDRFLDQQDALPPTKATILQLRKAIILTAINYRAYVTSELIELRDAFALAADNVPWVLHYRYYLKDIVAHREVMEAEAIRRRNPLANAAEPVATA